MLRNERASTGNDGIGGGCTTLSRAVQRLSSATRRAESRPSRIGPISFGVKQMGARNAGNPHVACDMEGAGDVVWVGTPGHTGAPALDPTDERDVETEPWWNH